MHPSNPPFPPTAIQPSNPVARPNGIFNLTCSLPDHLLTQGYNSSSIAFVVGTLRVDASNTGSFGLAIDDKAIGSSPSSDLSRGGGRPANVDSASQYTATRLPDHDDDDDGSKLDESPLTPADLEPVTLVSFGVDDERTARLVMKRVNRRRFNNVHLHCYAVNSTLAAISDPANPDLDLSNAAAADSGGKNNIQLHREHLLQVGQVVLNVNGWFVTAVHLL